MNIEFDPYSVLGISRNATADDVRRAHRRLAQRLHPDLNHSLGAGEQFQDITIARDLLLDTSLRQQVDGQLKTQQTQGDSYFTLRVTPSKRAIVPLPEEQIIYLLAEIFAAPVVEEKPKQETRLNITLVIDHSNSMKGQRIERVKNAVQRVIKDLHVEDIISVVAFNDRASVIIPATTARDKPQLQSRVGLLQAAGGTEIYQGLLAGFEQNKQFAGPRMVNHILLLTDGHTFGDQENCYALARKASEQGIIISGMGLGHEWNDEFLDKLTSITGGASLYVNSVGVVMNYFNDHIKALSNAFAERMFLSVAPDPDVRLEMAFQLAPTPQPLPIEDGRIPLASLQPNRHISILLQFILPANMGEGFRSVARLVAGGDILQNTTQSFRAISDVALEITANPPREEPAMVIMDALSKLTLYRLQERAREALEAGDIAEATRRLENLSTRLFEMGETSLASQAAQEAQHLSRTKAFSEEGGKAIKYQTRALVGTTNIADAVSSYLTQSFNTSTNPDRR